jgi:hypothetical protein
LIFKWIQKDSNKKMSSSTTFLPVRSYSSDIPLTLSAPESVGDGQRQNVSSDKKQLVIAFPNVPVKACVNGAKQRPFLVVSTSEDSAQLIATLNAIRDRFIAELKLEDSAFTPILSTGKGLLNKAPSLYLNLLPKATVTDITDRRPISYESLVGKTFKAGVFVHIASIFHGEDDHYSLQYKVSQLVITQPPTADVQEVVEIEQCLDDTALML